MKKYFFTGLIIFLPIVITLLIAIFIFDLLTNPFVGIIEYVLNNLHLSPDKHSIVLFFSRVISLVVLIVFIFLLGFLAHQFLTKWFIQVMDKLFRKIPIIKSIYKITTDMTKSFFQTDQKPFKKTVLLHFPNEKATAYAFLTGIAPKEVEQKEQSKEKMKSVFLPTAPHPISGFLLLVQESLLQDVDISVEDIFKTLVSCGLYTPGEENEQTGAKNPVSSDHKKS